MRVTALEAPAGHLSPGFPCTQRGDPQCLLCCLLRVHQATDLMQKMCSSPSGEGASSTTSPSHNESPSGYCLHMSTVQELIPHSRATTATAGQIEVSKLRHVPLWPPPAWLGLTLPSGPHTSQPGLPHHGLLDIIQGGTLACETLLPPAQCGGLLSL